MIKAVVLDENNIVLNNIIVNELAANEREVSALSTLKKGDVYTVDAANPSVVVPASPVVKNALLSNFIIKSNNTTVANVANIYSLQAKATLNIMASVDDIDNALAAMLTALNVPQAKMTVMAERVRGGNVLDVIDDVRFDMMIDATSLTIASMSGFEISGNYVVTQERMNKGLKAVGSPFEIQMPMLEFDVINA